MRRVIQQTDGAYDNYTSVEDNMLDSDNNSLNSSINSGENNDDYCMNILLTNARSLLPKMDSLTDAFGSLRLQFAAITETWFKPGKGLNGCITDIEGATGIRILHCSRDGRRKSTGGGVAFAFDINTCNFKKRKFSSGAAKLELLCVVGNVKKIDRKVVVFVVYLPPSCRVVEVAAYSEVLASDIAAMKTAFKNPIIMVGGDFNRRDIADSLKDAEELLPFTTEATRGNATLDIMYTNIGAYIKEPRVLPPLASANGSESDHRCVTACATLPAQNSFQWVVKYTRKRSRRADEDFCRDLGTVDWAVVLEADGVDAKTRALETTIAALTDRHFPLIRARKRSNEAPWITHRIRRLFRKKCRIYKKYGRNESWWLTDERMQQEIKDSREEFVERTLAEGNSGRTFYAATKMLSSPGTAKAWKVSDLFAGASPKQVCDNVLGYFGSIAGSSSTGGE